MSDTPQRSNMDEFEFPDVIYVTKNQEHPYEYPTYSAELYYESTGPDEIIGIYKLEKVGRHIKSHTVKHEIEYLEKL